MAAGRSFSHTRSSQTAPIAPGHLPHYATFVQKHQPFRVDPARFLLPLTAADLTVCRVWFGGGERLLFSRSSIAGDAFHTWVSPLESAARPAPAGVQLA